MIINKIQLNEWEIIYMKNIYEKYKRNRCYFLFFILLKNLKLDKIIQKIQKLLMIKFNLFKYNRVYMFILI